MSDTMREGVNEIEELKGALQRLADAAADKFQEVSDTASAFLTALNYQDQALVDSANASLLAAFAEVASKCVVMELGATARTKSGLKEAWLKYIDKKAYELTVFEDIKDEIESIIDERMARMLKARDFLNNLEALDQQVKNAQALKDGIRDLRRFREELLKGWPSRKPSSPLNQAVIAEARAAIKRGERGMSKEELVWGNRRSEKAAGE
jgi:hypothetical protein